MNSRSPIVIIFALLIVGSAFGYFFAWPAYETNQAQQRVLLGAIHDLDSAKAKRKIVKQIEANASTIHDHAVLAKQLIPTTEDRESFINEYDNLAKQNSVNLTVLNFTEVTAKSSGTAKKAKKTETPLTFTSTLVGNYLNIRQLLEQMKATHRYVTITAVAIASAEQGIIATVDGQIYTRPEPKIPDQLSVKPSNWNYLDRINKPTSSAELGSSTGRPDPYSPY